MKSVITLFTVWVLLSVCFVSCSKELPDLPSRDEQPETPGESGNDDGYEDHMSNKFEMTVGTAVFSGSLADNATAGAFRALLPITVNMSELNGNEKYFYLPEALTAAPVRPGTILTGDLMLYGSSCLVLFYKTFPASYSYTKIGSIDDPSGLGAAVGQENIRITFELK